MKSTPLHINQLKPQAYFKLAFNVASMACLFISMVYLNACTQDPMGMQVVLDDPIITVIPNVVSLDVEARINQSSYVFETLNVSSELNTSENDLLYSWTFTFDTRNPQSSDAENFECSISNVKGSASPTPFDSSSDPRCLDGNMILQIDTMGRMPRFKPLNHYSYDIKACVAVIDIDGTSSQSETCSTVAPRFFSHGSGSYEVFDDPINDDMEYAVIHFDSTNPGQTGPRPDPSSSDTIMGTVDSFTYQWIFDIYEDGHPSISPLPLPSFQCELPNRVVGSAFISEETTLVQIYPNNPNDPDLCSGYTVHGRGKDIFLRTPSFADDAMNPLVIRSCIRFRDGWFDSTSRSCGGVLPFMTGLGIPQTFEFSDIFDINP